MVYVINKRCLFENCNKRPAYNYENIKKGIYCNDHKLQDMIDVVNKRCLFENCNIKPTYNYNGIKTAIFCNNHIRKNDRCKT